MVNYARFFAVNCTNCAKGIAEALLLLRRLLIIALVVLPPALFLLWAGPLLLPDDSFWAFIAILGSIAAWIAALAGPAQMIGVTLRELWTPAVRPTTPAASQPTGQPTRQFSRCV